MRNFCFSRDVDLAIFGTLGRRFINRELGRRFINRELAEARRQLAQRDSGDAFVRVAQPIKSVELNQPSSLKLFKPTLQSICKSAG
jgi:hypothetical protein